jgi:hypothetical protein
MAEERGRNVSAVCENHNRLHCCGCGRHVATIEEQRQRIEELEATIERMHTGSAVSAAMWSEAVTVAVDRAEQAESERDAARAVLIEAELILRCRKSKHLKCWKEGYEVIRRALARNPEGPPRRSTRATTEPRKDTSDE